MFHVVGCVEVEKCCGSGVVLQTDLAGVFRSAPCWVEQAVIENVREGAAHCLGHCAEKSDTGIGRFAAAGNFVVVNGDLLDKAVIALVLGSEDLLGDG